MQLSVLVVSRTPELLSKMLRSLAAATSLASEQLEILCSWNGSEIDEKAIENYSGFELLIALREPYHFATNMNVLAERANGELLLLINDDVELDAGSIDAALEALHTFPNAGLIGARLRDGDGLLTHAGILFDSHHSPYHQLDRVIGSEHAAVLGASRAVPAVTGALMLIKREHFHALRFSEDFTVCGEDVELCLNVRERLGLNAVYNPKFSGLHIGEATRSEFVEQRGNSEDLSRLRARHRRFLEAANQHQLQVELKASVSEAEVLRSLETHRQNESKQISNTLAELERRSEELSNPDLVSRIEMIEELREQITQELTEEISLKLKKLSATELSTLKKDLFHWQQQAHTLQLSRLKLEQALKHAQRSA